MTPRAYLLAGFLFILLAMSSWAHAETIPATPAYDTAQTTSSYSGNKLLHCTAWPSGELYLNASGAMSRIEQLCAAVTPGQSRRWTGSTYQILDFDNVTWRNVYNLIANGTSCPTGYTKNASNYCEKVTYSCPANQGWTLSGSSCTRVDCPYARNPDGTCAGQCDGKGNQDAASGYYTSPPALICKTGCVAKRFSDLSDVTSYTIIENGVPKTYQKYAYSYVADVSNTANGISCSVINEALVNTPEPSKIADPANATQSCGSGQTGGYVNGKYTCVDNTSGQPVAESGTKTPTTTTKNTVTNPDGSTTTTEITNYSDGTSSTKTTTTQSNGNSSSQTVDKDASGNVTYSGPSGSAPGSGTGTGTNSAAVSDGVKDGIKKYCDQYPDSPICKGEEEGTVSGGTSCETPPTCSGDPIQCALLRQQWENRCQTAKINQALGENNALAEQLAQVGEDAMTGEPTDLGEFTDEIDVSNQISTAKFLSGSGLQDKVIALPMGKTLTIPFSQLNQYLAIFGNLMVIIAMLAAARIVGVL